MNSLPLGLVALEISDEHTQAATATWCRALIGDHQLPVLAPAFKRRLSMRRERPRKETPFELGARKKRALEEAAP